LKTIEDFDDEIISSKIKLKAKALGVDKKVFKGDFNHDGKDLLFIGDDKSCVQSSIEPQKEISVIQV
jgi:hypothetical protein